MLVSYRSGVIFPDRRRRSVWWSSGTVKGPCSPKLGHVWCWGPGHEERAGVVGHFHQACNLTIVSSFFASSKQNLFVSHFSEAQRHPQRNLIPHISLLGFKLRKVSIWYIFPVPKSCADCLHIKQERVSLSHVVFSHFFLRIFFLHHANAKSDRKG